MIIVYVLITLALVTVPVLVTREILAYLRERKRSVVVLSETLQQFFDNTAEFRKLALSLAAFVDAQTGLASEQTSEPLAVPEKIFEVAVQESEPWAQEDMIGKARELFTEFRAAEDSDDATWARVLSELNKV